MFKKWISYLGHGSLDQAMPILLDRLKYFEKHQTIVKAKAFTKQNLIDLFSVPDTSDTLLLKAYAAITISFAARGCESFDFEWRNLRRIDNGFVVSYQHKKTEGPLNDFDQQIISGKN